MSNLDRVTRVANRALDVLFTKHPERTCLGVMMGLVLSGLSRVLGPKIALATGLDPESAGPISYVALGILVIHLPSLVHFVRHRPRPLERWDAVLAAIERGNFSDAERRQEFRKLVDAAMGQATMNQQATEQLRATRRRLRER